MTEWAHTRGGQDVNQSYVGSDLSVSAYGSGQGVNYVQGDVSFSQINPSYPTYSTPYISNQHQSANMLYLAPSQINMNYQISSHRPTSMQPQSRSAASNTYYHHGMQSSRSVQHVLRFPVTHDVSLLDTEEQESGNQETQRSEPVHPPLEGFPDVDEFDRLMKHYVENLSPKKQDKALIHAKRAANIKAVLIDKKTTSVESAQFRFWVKKMFTLYPNDPNVPAKRKKICHDNKPVAIREKLFKILTRAHKQCQHGGRDKTSAQVRRVYSWVPKELISRFVKICPTCQVRRGTNRGSPTESVVSQDAYMDTVSPTINSPIQSRRESVATSHSSIQSPTHMGGFSSTFHQQNRWMTPLDPSEKLEDSLSKLDTLSSPLGSTFTNPSHHHTAGPEFNGRSAFSHMDAMELSSSGYHEETPQHLPYHTGDMRYSYKHSHYKENRRY